MSQLIKNAVDRRDFLRRSGLALSTGAMMSPFGALTMGQLRAQAAGGSEMIPNPFGPLRPTLDLATGLPLLRLPPGFRYQSFGWVGDTLPGDQRTPEDHDGGAVVKVEGRMITYIRNHEQAGGLTFPNSGTTFFDGNPAGTRNELGNFNVQDAMDGNASGGCSRGVFDGRKVVSIEPAIGATSNNCAGGPTPFGSWITCEETFGPGGTTHGFALEVPAEGLATGIPLMQMGRFEHEAIAVDPASATVLLTEDNFPTFSGVFLFVPNSAAEVFANNGYTRPDGSLIEGTLYMMAVAGQPNAVLTGELALGTSFRIESVAIPVGDGPEQVAGPPISVADVIGSAPFSSFANAEGELDDGGDSRGGSISSPFVGGFRLGGAIFARPEGAWYSNGTLFFLDTNAGFDRTGTATGILWAYTPDPGAPQNGTLEVVYAPTTRDVTDGPDNLTINPRTGTPFLCEDGSQDVQRLIAVTPSGDSFVFAENNIILTADQIAGPTDLNGNPRVPEFVDGDFAGIAGNEPLSFTGAEWAGASFSPDGNTLFINVQGQGWSFAIQGPFSRLLSFNSSGF